MPDYSGSATYDLTLQIAFAIALVTVLAGSFVQTPYGRFSDEKYGMTRFHENGQLMYCELSRNHTIEGRGFRRGDAIRFDREGQLIESK